MGDVVGGREERPEASSPTTKTSRKVAKRERQLYINAMVLAVIVKVNAKEHELSRAQLSSRQGVCDGGQEDKVRPTPSFNNS